MNNTHHFNFSVINNHLPDKVEILTTKNTSSIFGLYKCRCLYLAYMTKNVQVTYV